MMVSNAIIRESDICFMVFLSFFQFEISCLFPSLKSIGLSEMTEPRLALSISWMKRSKTLSLGDYESFLASTREEVLLN